MDPDVPLVVPEVNPEADRPGTPRRGIIANPNCSTIQNGDGAEAAAMISPASSAWWFDVSIVSGAGREAMASSSFRRAASTSTISKERHFTKQIPSTVIPHIDVFMEDGATKEEWKMAVGRPARSWIATSR